MPDRRPTAEPALLAEIRRGDIVESRIRGHVAVVDADGEVVAQAGDPTVVVTARSTVKPFQAIPYVHRAVDALGLSTDELAIACSSHRAEPVHVAVVEALLARAGVDDSALACGPRLPGSRAAAHDVIAKGEGPRRVFNVCSGKHAAMLVACRVAGWTLDGYHLPEHPLQKAIVDAWRDVGGVDLDARPFGIDGCGLPTYSFPLQELARAFARAATSDDDAFRRCQAAVAKAPILIAGTGEFDSVLLASNGERLTAKSGAAATWCAVRRPAGPGVAIKLEAGADEAMPAVALAVLRQLGWLPEPVDASLAAFAAPSVLNTRGEAVGETRAVVKLDSVN